MFSNRRLTYLFLKISAFQFNNPSAFPRAWAVDVQPILEFLQLIHDYLTRDSTIKLPVCILPVV